MVGLSIVLEAQKGGVNKKTPQVINKATMMINKPSSSFPSSSSFSFHGTSQSSFQVPTFLEQCFLCGKKLLLGKDVYMYKGDRAFCSVECRCRQIFMDEEETLSKDNCSLAAMKPTSASSSSSSRSSSASRHRKSTRNQAGGFAC